MPETALQGCPTCVFSRGVMTGFPVALHGKKWVAASSGWVMTYEMKQQQTQINILKNSEENIRHFIFYLLTLHDYDRQSHR